MGTRGLTAVVIDGEYKVAQYGQWNHYPETAGISILSFLREIMSNKKNLETFKEKIRNLRWMTDDDIEKANKELKKAKDKYGWMGEHEHLFRDLGYNILRYIYERYGKLSLINQIDFAADSLFCEYAYVIDLDKMTFEVYEGFNKRKLNKKERFANLSNPKKYSGYEPVRLIATYDLNNLPTDKQLLSDTATNDE